MKKRNFAMVLAAAMMASLLGGTTSSAADKGGEDIVIKFGVYETDNLTAGMWQEMIDAFEADNPGIKVEKVLATGDDRIAFWKTMLSSGSFPDIVLEAHSLATVEGIFAEVPEDIQALFDPATLCTYNGKCITIPATKQLRMQCYYNKKIFEELNLEEPKTWDEFVGVCQAVKDADKVPLICGGTGDVWATGEPYWISVANQAIEAEYPDFNQDLKEGKAVWNNDTAKDALEKWQEMVQKGYYYEGSMSLSYSQAADEFKKGTAAMMIDGSWLAAGLDAEGKEDFGVFAVPTLDGTKSYCATYQYWGVSEACENKDAAFQFVKYVFDTNQEIYKKYLISDGLYSTTVKPVSYDQGPVTTKFVENFDGWSLVPEIVLAPGEYSLPSGMQTYMDKSFQNIFNGADITGELENWDAEYERLIEGQ